MPTPNLKDTSFRLVYEDIGRTERISVTRVISTPDHYTAEQIDTEAQLSAIHNAPAYVQFRGYKLVSVERGSNKQHLEAAEAARSSN